MTPLMGMGFGPPKVTNTEPWFSFFGNNQRTIPATRPYAKPMIQRPPARLHSAAITADYRMSSLSKEQALRPRTHHTAIVQRNFFTWKFVGKLSGLWVWTDPDTQMTAKPPDPPEMQYPRCVAAPVPPLLTSPELCSSSDIPVCTRSTN